MRRMTQIKERINATYDLADPKQTLDDLLDKLKGSRISDESMEETYKKKIIQIFLYRSYTGWRSY